MREKKQKLGFKTSEISKANGKEIDGVGYVTRMIDGIEWMDVNAHEIILKMYSENLNKKAKIEENKYWKRKSHGVAYFGKDSFTSRIKEIKDGK